MIAPAPAATSSGQAAANKRIKAHQSRHHHQRHQHPESSDSAGTVDATFTLRDMAESIGDVERHQQRQKRPPSPAEAVDVAPASSPRTGPAASAPALDNIPRPVDRRLLVQASKLAFIVSKRRQVLTQAGFTLRREERSTIQEFLDRTWAARHVSCQGFNPLLGPTNNVACPPAVGFRREGMDGREISALRAQCSANYPGSAGGDGDGDGDGGGVGGGASDRGRGGGGGGGGSGGSGPRARDFVEFSVRFEEWRDMTFVFCEELGWVFLHQATKTAVEVVKALIRSTHCQEMGVLLADPVNKATIEGLASVFESSNDVSICFTGAIAKIAGTELQVSHVARAIEAIDSSSQRLHSAAHWYFQGPVLATAIDHSPPWFPMDAEANRGLEETFLRRGEGEVDGGMYQVGGVTYYANFTLMTQSNAATGFVRPIKRVITDRRSYRLPRCPQRNMPLTLTGFREGATVSLVDVSQEEDRMVRAAVTFSYKRSAVMQVQHIWNSFLWEHYAQNAKSIGNECMLFHGAHSEAIGTILRTGFEKRLAGSKNGANYGQGCYFARDACLAAQYMAPPSCGGQMIMAKVLVGAFTHGHKHMVIPPRIPGSERHYDTTSNSNHSPALIVTYKDWQAYPMYLITFAPQSG